MPKIDQDVLKDFGKAVKRASALKEWNQQTLGGKMNPPVGASFISKVERGRKDNLNARTVGRFIKALDLDESWIDKFLDAEDAADGLETKAEQEADRVIDRLRREGKAEGTSDDLLIQLANNFTEGDHKDTDTAFRSVEAALERLKASENIAQLAGNADAQFAALMTEVDDLNNAGEFDLAHDKLAEQAATLREEKDRLARLSELQLEKELNQDRLRNRPDMAAERIVTNLREFPKGKLYAAVNDRANKWKDQGDNAGDIFALEVALALAQRNYQMAKTKKPLAAYALKTVGWCHFRLAERSSENQHLIKAKRALSAALKKTSKTKEPGNWASRQNGLGAVLLEMGIREQDQALLQEALVAHRAALSVAQKSNAINADIHWTNLGNALEALGELTNDANTLREAEAAHAESLSHTDKESDALGWQATQSNLAVAQRWLGAVTRDQEKLQESRDSYAACAELAFEKDAPFDWARLQWNIADLALARYQLGPEPALLTEARDHLARARAFFVDGSDYQTERCDDLLTKIIAAEAAA